MPIVDMPLEKLKTFEGAGKCPEDYEEYWDRAMKELEAIKPALELIPAEFEAPGYKCYHMYFNGTQNSRIHCKLVIPNKKEKMPAVMMFHGYSGDSGDWTEKLSYASCGFVVCAMDVRGQAGMSEDKNTIYGNTLNGHVTRGLLDKDADNLFFRQVYLDAARAAMLVMEMDEVDETRVGAIGSSQGGALSIACASLVPTISKISIKYPFLCDFKRVWDMDLDVAAYVDLRQFFRNFDPTHEHENEYFEKLGYIDLKNMSDRINADVLMMTGLMDNICPPSTQFAMYNKIKSKKSVVISPDFGHEDLKGSADKSFSFMLPLLNK